MYNTEDNLYLQQIEELIEELQNENNPKKKYTIITCIQELQKNLSTTS